MFIMCIHSQEERCPHDAYWLSLNATMEAAIAAAELWAKELDVTIDWFTTGPHEAYGVASDDSNILIDEV